MAAAGAVATPLHGYYVVVPAERVGDRSWRPTIEGFALALAQRVADADGVALMGVSAGRLHGALPRALATAVVVAAEQRRVLSHMIRAVAELDDGDVVFFGGTALCRVYLTEPPWLRLSEDLDLLVVGDSRAVNDRFEDDLPRVLRREFPTWSWTVAPAARSPSPALLSADGFNVRVQLVPATAGWASWRRVPTRRRPVGLRYDDLPDAVDLSVPTVEGFAAMKLAAWENRQTPRDLFDLAGLTTLNAFTTGTLDVFVELCDRPPDLYAYRRLPVATADSWHSQLAHQAAAEAVGVGLHAHARGSRWSGMRCRSVPCTPMGYTESDDA